jgi:DNA-binding LacI/PurR family transcriptional regulator
MTRIRNIKDLAELAKVSTGTVSRALAGSGLISTATRERIQALATEHGFHPNAMARNLRTQRTGAIGVIIPMGHAAGQRMSDPFFMTILGYLTDGLSARGYDVLLSRVVPEDDGWLKRFVTSGRVDGVLVIGQSDQTEALDALADDYLPMVVWGGHTPGQGYCSVGTDNHHGAMLATQHLIARGCRRIDFFGNPNATEFRQRLDGCRAAMAEAGLGEQLRVLPAQLMPELAHAEIARYLASSTDVPDGIFAASDVIGVSALRALAEQGLRVPEDVRVISFDGMMLCQYTSPQLSSIAQDIESGAAHMIDILLRRIAGEKTESVVLEPRLEIRQSS